MSNSGDDLKREIGFVGLSANIVNIVIGSGIFVLPAIIAAALGAASILAYVFCGILITLLMLCVAEVGSKITDTGGTYIYIEKTFGKYAGFLAVWLMLFASITGIAAIANAVVGVVFTLLPAIESEAVRILFFAVTFFGFGAINVIGLKTSVVFVKLITLAKIVPLLLIVFLGFKDMQLGNLVWEDTPSLQQIGATSLILYFAFTGAGTALSVSGEVRNPQKIIPRAIIFSIFLVGAVYVAVQTVSQGVLGDTLPSFIENPLGAVASKVFGPVGFTLLTIGAAVSMFGSMSSQVLSFPRVLFAASKDEVIPVKLLSRVHGKYVTPHIAIIVYVSLAFIFACFGGFQGLAIMSSAAALFISLSMSVAVIKLRRSKAFVTDANTFKIPGGYTVPILSFIVIVWFLSNLSAEKFIGLGILTAVLSVFYLVINWKTIKRITS